MQRFEQGLEKGMKTDSRAADLVTLRDLLRYAVTTFERAGLVYGHGTETALDEAAFLLLARLDLPIDNLDPWLDARLTLAERADCLALIDARVTTRKPAPYLVGKAWIGPFRFSIDERVIVPRSYLGEMLVEGLAGRLDTDLEPERILDLCTGSGCLAIIAAECFPAAAVTAVDISPDALDVARGNVDSYGLSDRVRLVESDLFAALEGETFDLILTNPPYVTDAAVAAFPPEYDAEPRIAHAGGPDGMDLVRRILADAARHLAPRGWLVAEVGAARETLETDPRPIPYLWLDSANAAAEVFVLTREALVASAAPEPSRRPGGTASRARRRER